MPSFEIILQEIDNLPIFKINFPIESNLGSNGLQFALCLQPFAVPPCQTTVPQNPILETDTVQVRVSWIGTSWVAPGTLKT